MLEQIIIQEDTINEIRRNVIIPEIKREVLELASSPRYWRKISNLCQTLGMILNGLSIILTFTAAGMNRKDLSIYSGIVGTVGIFFNQFSNHAQKESKERTDEYNKLLTEVLHIKPIPDLTQVMNNTDIEKGEHIK
jgi:hypothetical protein